MTDRTISLIVTLDKEIRVENAEPIMKAIGMIKHVLSVQPNVFTDADQINAMSARVQIKRKILDEFFLFLDKV